MIRMGVAGLVLVLAMGCSADGQSPPTPEELIADAVTAAPRSLAAEASVVDWEGNVLREGGNGWTCMPTPPGLQGTAPMCLDGPWLAWADAWMNRGEVRIDGVGIAYMLAGDGGASNTDPFAEGPTEDNEWVVAGPHLMLIAPDTRLLDGIPADPDNGGPWVMWRGTPYAHVMIPVGGG